MAGMFYSLKEAAAKLSMTEQEVKELAKQGKLREFRDGSNLLFKVDEVEALMADTGVMASQDEPLPAEEPEESVLRSNSTKDEFAEAPESELTFEPEEMGEVELEPEAEEEAFEQPIEPEEEVAAEEIDEEAGGEIGEAAEEVAEAAEEQDEEILLAQEGGAPAVEGDLTSADTALTGEGVNVLGETDRDYKLTDDTMAETTVAPGTTGGTAGISGTTGEALLEEIEDDVSLDSFGSGSGLLDLSLQADDTSLGGILDEIYTAEGGEEGQESDEPASAMDIVAEAESAAGGIPEEDLIGPAPVSVVPEVATMAQPYIEAQSDAMSNSLGIMLFLPLLALVYAGIVTVAALRDVMPTILGKIKTPYIGLYIIVGFSVAALLTFGVSFMLSGGISTAGTKEKKPKKPKEKKPKKEKKAKKSKKTAS
jgi:excisionase family DNA binding protein